MKALVKNLSICPCGFPVLNDNIKIGHEYVIHPDTIMEGNLVCGGCGKTHPINLIKVGDPILGFMPLEVFNERMSNDA